MLANIWRSKTGLAVKMFSGVEEPEHRKQELFLANQLDFVRSAIICCELRHIRTTHIKPESYRSLHQTAPTRARSPIGVSGGKEEAVWSNGSVESLSEDAKKVGKEATQAGPLTTDILTIVNGLTDQSSCQQGDVGPFIREMER
jgi:hypothetical protein